MLTRKKAALGEILFEKGLITRRELELGLKEQQGSSELLGKTLVRLGLLTEEQLCTGLSEQLNISYVRVKDQRVDPEIFKKLPARFACHYKILPLKFEANKLTIAVTDPLDIRLLDDLRILLGCEIEVVLSSEKEIQEGIRQYYGIGAETIEKIIEKTPLNIQAPLGKTKENIDTLAEDASIIRFVNQLLVQAFKDRSTDIHIEPYEEELRVRYRIDGILYDITIPQNMKYFQSAIISRIKIMADLDIAERRLPQDGRIKIRIGDNELDLRISILPTLHGESVDIRILSAAMLYSLENLGLSQNDLQILENLIKRPHGIIFVTGPTGSGKTTTLYACLSKINAREKKIITIEDPIEYQIQGITQIQVHPKIGLNFATALRSMLRHDPDIMMVGEVRDFETAEITIRVALTGHLVFSTLHTNDAAGGITRLLDMGIEPYLVASSVESFIAQRLVRLICRDCKIQIRPDKEILDEFGIEDSLKDVIIYEGKGCESCKFTGYKGRTAIYEFLNMNEELRDIVLHRASSEQIKKKALQLGMHTLRMDGWEKVKKGLTTLNEVIRVTQQD